MRNPEYQFVDTSAEPILSQLIAAWEYITKRTLMPASPDSLYIRWVADAIIHERVLNNYTGNQNIPSRASGIDLDALGELFCHPERPEAQPAVCTERIYISAPQGSSILIPRSTKITDASGVLIWETTDDEYIQIGEIYADVALQCQTAGIIGNGYAIGQISRLVDIDNIAYYDHCENITVSDKGADRAADNEYYKLMRDSQDAYSTAGAKGAYIYYAKKVSTEIADVVANSLTPGVANLFVLMSDGSIAGSEIKGAVYAECSPDDVRPFTDYVTVDDPEVVSYGIDFKYYIPTGTKKSSAAYEREVEEAIDDYIMWQHRRLGRDINPDELRQRVKSTGIKRIGLSDPVFVPLRDGRDNTIPQVASVATINVVNGGYEDE